MAAEDYIDFERNIHGVDDHSFFKSKSPFHQSKAGKKNKDIEWVTSQGEVIRVGDMEDSHLGNVVRYIVRKMDEHELAVDMMHERGFVVPPYVINKRSGDEWLEIFGKEANRRKKKEIKKARQILNGTLPA